MSDFVHLHLHSEYSLLDGAVRIEDLIQRAVDDQMPAVAITDHGVMYGAIKFYRQAMAAGIKPIIGCEMYVAPRSRYQKEARVDEQAFHLTLLAENNQGYQNLLTLTSKASLEGFYYRPRIDLELLREHSDGLIALSGCLAGQIPRLLLKEQWELAREVVTTYLDIFGPHHFYIEIQNHQIQEQQEVLPRLIQLAKEMGLGLVATNDVHYLDAADANVQDILLCIQTGKTISEKERLRFQTDQLYFKSSEEMEALFSNVPEALKNTIQIAERCHVELDFEQFHLPHFQLPPNKSSTGYLRELCTQGVQERYPVSSQEVWERMDYELGVIEEMGFTSYFLIVQDFVAYARKQGIPVGPGRGSAAGSLVAYLLGITNVDPLEYGLIFERFLNPERVTMPDIDIDFCYVRRDEVIRYVSEKYGQDRVAQIITFGTMAARAVIRDVGRVLELPYSRVDKIAKLIPRAPGMTIERALESSPDLKKMVQEDRDAREIIRVGQKLEGLPRHASTHAAGVVISKEPLDSYTPIQKNKEEMMTQYDMDDLESIGLLKMDFLGLRTLTIIHDTIEMLQKRGIALDLEEIPLDDPAAYRILKDVQTAGIFQMESRLYQRLCKDLQPDNFEDIVAMMALGRPGALQSGMVEDYIRCRHGEQKVEYLHPTLESILEETYGLILYQEQVMQIASKLAGYSLGEADILRRGMGKKKEALIQSHRKRFVGGAVKRGIPEKTAHTIFDLMEYFGGYGFNKSHSAGYGLIAYQTAYLKAYYPVEFMAATLTSVMGSSSKVAFYIDECQQMGIQVLPPDVNQSGIHFTVVDAHQIRFGLAAIKNVGRGAISEIVRGRRKKPYESLVDLCQRVDLRKVNHRVLESLIRCGALDSLQGRRSQYMNVLESVIQRAQQMQRQEANGQLALGESLQGFQSAEDLLPELPEYEPAEILQMEKELLGLFLTGHPLDPYRQRFQTWIHDKMSSLEEVDDGTDVVVGGLVTDLKNHTTKRGARMAFLFLEDWTGGVDCVVFPQEYEKYRHLLKKDQPLLVTGKINEREDEISLIVNRILPLDQEFLIIKIPNEKETPTILQELAEMLPKYKGQLPVILQLDSGGKEISLVTDDNFWIRKEEIVIEEIRNILGSEGQVCYS